MTLTSLIFFPILASILLVFIKDDLRVRQFSLAAGFVEILLALPLFTYTPGGNVFQFVERVPWVPKWGLNYYLGIDGISLTMILLTILLLPLCVLCSWRYIEKRVKEFHICLLLMASVCIGVFSALDFVLFYVFWEAMLVPMFLLIAVWGGPKRKYASLKFIIYTLSGSTLLLVAIIAFYTQTGTFSIPEMMKHNYSFTFQYWAFLAMALAFAIKVPMFPFHTWLPAAHVEAPTAGSVVLASVLLKMGTYGFLRFTLPLTPDASIYFAPMMIGFSIASILYGGFVALGQNDMKKLIAYSSVGHMGFVTLGIFMFNLRGLEGAVMQMINHGITTGGLFMMVGAVYERSHSREINDNKGLGKFLPAYMFFFGLFSLSSLAFPGTNSFVGEILVLIGAFQNNYWVGAMAIPGALLAAAYMLRLLQKMAWGEPSSVPGWHGAANKKKFDINLREWAYLVPLALLVIYLGLAPGLTLRTIDPSLNQTLSKIQTLQQQPSAVALNIE
ncbi:MAG: NADH-quinone oxidoreductase subunit M [Desulfobacterales bacterium CG23_combo_of_CG06-09_8_20_14_all_51_8]|nr:MAG: NADH-quinone oxidoreductase subunit M [Desulfobacterales bacterium CG23_combo_of_CG06-09_8_20_14_all_51_8]